MAKLFSKDTQAGFSGRIGNMVTYVPSGIQIARSLPQSDKKHKLSVLQKSHISSFNPNNS